MAFPALAIFTVPPGSSISSFEATITVPPAPTTVSDASMVWWIGLEPANQSFLLQSILSWNGSEWVVTDGYTATKGGDALFTTDAQVVVLPGAQITFQITETSPEVYIAKIPGYTPGITFVSPAPLMEGIIALEVNSVPASIVGTGETFSNIHVQITDAQGHVSSPTIAWSAINNDPINVHTTIVSPTEIAISSLNQPTPPIVTTNTLTNTEIGVTGIHHNCHYGIFHNVEHF